jgi:hypothetical protein
VISCVSPNNLAIGSALHARLLSHLVATSFNPNGVLQSRSIVSLGVMCCSPKLITEELFSGVLIMLKRSLQGFSLGEDYGDVPVAILHCLSRMYVHLPTESIFFKPMFWIAMLFLQINNPQFFQPALLLIEIILKTLEDRGCFQEMGVTSFLMSARATMELELVQLDQVTGISFNSNFSFATSAHFLKGFRYPLSKATTMRLLSTFVDLTARKTVGAEILGYLAALLPIKGDKMYIHQILLPATADDLNPYSLLFTQQMVPETMHAALFFAFLTAMLNTSDSEYEQLFIYECIKEGVKKVPEAFGVVYNTLVTRLGYAIHTSQNKQILKVVLKIMESTFTWNPPKQSDLYNESYLQKIGFQGLNEIGYFSGKKIENFELKTEHIVILVERALDRLFLSANVIDKQRFHRTRSQPLPKHLERSQGFKV